MQQTVGAGAQVASLFGHYTARASAAAVVIGRRELTRGCFLDRRAFLPSYDPRGDDSLGSLLEVVLAPALMVCSVRTWAREGLQHSTPIKERERPPRALATAGNQFGV